MKTVANILLGIWLIATGMVSLGGLRVPSTVLMVLGIVTGILFLLADRSEKLWPRMADILLGIWLLAAGLMPLLHIRFSGSGVILAVIAAAAGALILIRH